LYINCYIPASYIIWCLQVDHNFIVLFKIMSVNFCLRIMFAKTLGRQLLIGWLKENKSQMYRIFNMYCNGYYLISNETSRLYLYQYSFVLNILHLKNWSTRYNNAKHKINFVCCTVQSLLSNVLLILGVSFCF